MPSHTPPLRDLPLYLTFALAFILILTSATTESALLVALTALPTLLWALVYFRERGR